MYLRVEFRDNDFCSVIEEACYNLMNEIAGGYKEKEALKRYSDYKSKYGIENFRKSIVLGAYGNYIARKAARIYNEINFDFSDQDYYVDYLDKLIELEEVDKIDPDDDNNETCYIDFYYSKIYLK